MLGVIPTGSFADVMSSQSFRARRCFFVENPKVARMKEKQHTMIDIPLQLRIVSRPVSFLKYHFRMSTSLMENYSNFSDSSRYATSLYQRCIILQVVESRGAWEIWERLSYSIIVVGNRSRVRVSDAKFAVLRTRANSFSGTLSAAHQKIEEQYCHLNKWCRIDAPERTRGGKNIVH